MAKICELFGISGMNGNRVSHANNRTKHKQFPNLKKKKYLVPELSRSVTLTLSTRAIRSIEKLGGISAAVISSKTEKMSERLQSVRRQLVK